MTNQTSPLKSPATWTLGAGALLAAGTMASILAQPARAQDAPETRVAVTPAPAVAERRAASPTVAAGAATLRALDTQFSSLAEAVGPAVVHIRSESGQNANPTSGGQGSGAIIRADGYIVTNDHVVAGFERVTVVLKDGREFRGKVTTTDVADIAVVKIEATGLPTLPFADSRQVRPGQFAVAIGAPFGLENTVTVGHVSAVGRTNAPIPDMRVNRVRQYYDLVQTDAPINMGNSGGPLLNIDGQIIGINSAIFSLTGGSNGIGFAISSNQAKMIVDTLIEKGKVARSYLGVYPVDLKEYRRRELGVSGGALIEDPKNGKPSPEAGSPADKAGLKVGDVVTRVGNVPVATAADLRNAMFRYAPAEKVTVEYLRAGERRTAEVTLAEPPKDQFVLNQRPPGQSSDTPNGRSFRFGPDEMRRFGSPEEMERELRRRFGQGFGQGEDERDVPPLGANPSRRASLGVRMEDATETSRKQFGLPATARGAVVITVAPESAASAAGLKPGDVIQQIGEKPVKGAETLVEAVAAMKPGDRKTVTVLRMENGQARTLKLETTLR